MLLQDRVRKEEGMFLRVELYDRDPGIDWSRLIGSKREAHIEQRLCDAF